MISPHNQLEARVRARLASTAEMTRQKNIHLMEVKMMNDSFFHVRARVRQQRNYVRAQAGQATTQLLFLILTLNELEDAC